jgi:ribonuclease D
VLHLQALEGQARRHAGAGGATELAAACFRFLPDRAGWTSAGWAAEDIFAHS